MMYKKLLTNQVSKIKLKLRKISIKNTLIFPDKSIKHVIYVYILFTLYTWRFKRIKKDFHKYMR